MDWTNIRMIARTKARESYSADNVFLCTEYAIKRIVRGNGEIDELYNKYGEYGTKDLFKCEDPYITLRRGVKTQNGVPKYGEWEILWFMDGPQNAVNFRDGRYLDDDTESLDPLHIWAKRYISRTTELRQELKHLEDRISPTQRHYANAGVTLVSSIYLEYTEKLLQALRDRRLFKKYQAGKVKQEVLGKIREPIAEEYNKELKAIEDRIGEINRELEELENEKVS